jgi:hypothetical protein
MPWITSKHHPKIWDFVSEPEHQVFSIGNLDIEIDRYDGNVKVSVSHPKLRVEGRMGRSLDDMGWLKPKLSMHSLGNLDPAEVQVVTDVLQVARVLILTEYAKIPKKAHSKSKRF